MLVIIALVAILVAFKPIFAPIWLGFTKTVTFLAIVLTHLLIIIILAILTFITECIVVLLVAYLAYLVYQYIYYWDEMYASTDEAI